MTSSQATRLPLQITFRRRPAFATGFGQLQRGEWFPIYAADGAHYSYPLPLRTADTTTLLDFEVCLAVPRYLLWVASQHGSHSRGYNQSVITDPPITRSPDHSESGSRRRSRTRSRRRFSPRRGRRPGRGCRSSGWCYSSGSCRRMWQLESP